MAVTVTKAAPSNSIAELYRSNYGPSGSSVFDTVDDNFAARKRVRLCKLTLSSTYVTGGFSLTPSDYGLKEIHGLATIADNNGAGGAGAQMRLTTTGGSPVVKLFSDTSTEFTNGGSVASFVYNTLIIGV